MSRTYHELRTLCEKKWGHCDTRFVGADPNDYFDSGIRVPFVKDSPEGARTPGESAADVAFLDAWVAARERQDISLKEFRSTFKIAPTISFYNGTQAIYDPLRDKTYELPKLEGPYLNFMKDLKAYVLRHRKVEGFDFSPYALENHPVVWLKYGSLHHSINRVVGMLDGRIAVLQGLESQAYTLPGLMQDTFPGLPSRTINGEEYLRLLPAIRLNAYAQSMHMLYTTMVWDESLAPHFERANQVREEFQSMLKLLPAVEIYGCVPVWVRYCGFGRDSQGGTIRLLHEPYCGEDNRLLYDGLGWILLLKFYDQFLPGRVVVQEDGKFIVSEWCFRETPNQSGKHYEMFSGAFNKHTLLSWCAGPMLDRFGSNPANTKMFEGNNTTPSSIFKMTPVIVDPLVNEIMKVIFGQHDFKWTAKVWMEKLDNLECPFGLAKQYNSRFVVFKVTNYSRSDRFNSLRLVYQEHIDTRGIRDKGTSSERYLTMYDLEGAYYVPPSILKVLFPEEPKAEQVVEVTTPEPMPAIANGQTLVLENDIPVAVIEPEAQP